MAYPSSCALGEEARWDVHPCAEPDRPHLLIISEAMDDVLLHYLEKGSRRIRHEGSFMTFFVGPELTKMHLPSEEQHEAGHPSML